MSTREHAGALSVSGFCREYSVSRTKFYDELKAGRLTAHKAGQKTLVLREDAEAWVNALPKLGGAHV